VIQKDLFGKDHSSSAQAIRVSPGRKVVKEKGKKILDTSSRTLQKLLHKQDPLTAFSKTFMVTLPWASTKCCLTWKAKATPHGRLLYQLVPKMLPIGEIDYGSSAKMWRTPIVDDSKNVTPNPKRHQGLYAQVQETGMEKLWATPRVGGEEGFESVEKRLGTQAAKKHNLYSQVQYEEMWLTPTSTNINERTEEGMQKRKEMRNKSGRNTVPPGNLAEQVKHGYPIKDMRESKLWPTPNAWDGNRGPRSKENLIEKNHQINLISAVKDAQDPEPVHMWPTPRAKEPGRTTKGYGRGLKELVEGKEQLWPTPRARDYKDGTSIPPSIKEGKRSHNLGTKVQEKMWPTPSANEDAAGQPGGKMQKMLGNHPELGKTKASGSLNPTWVEWLMGYPKGWTVLKD